MDFGNAKRETARMYKESDVHLLCGAGDKPFEVLEFAEALRQVRSVEPVILTCTLNSDCSRIFSSVVSDEPVVIGFGKDMLDYEGNTPIFKNVITKYIIETSKKL
jgi:hypothetical protein